MTSDPAPIWRDLAILAQLAAAIVAGETVLGRTGQPYYSHAYWRLSRRPAGTVLVATWAALTWHLHVPQRPWREAVRVGGVAAVAWTLTRHGRS